MRKRKEITEKTQLEITGEELARAIVNTFRNEDDMFNTMDISFVVEDDESAIELTPETRLLVTSEKTTVEPE